MARPRRGDPRPGTAGRSAPLVRPDDSDRLAALLGEVARGRAFLLQGGDCAEMIERATPAAVHGTVETLSRLAGTLERAFGLPVVTVGRLAGQYAKPRSSPWRRYGGSPCRRIAVTRSTAWPSRSGTVPPIPGACCAPTRPPRPRCG
ncbi:hypothetical protein SHKM778_25910 [Streptomyces sp. KM77-8]|uniref:Phospho-2-dehydro-3-deoxyheptonate aldolase n=1 Tax=Streptomyces haneummycinicus TaxID=3074435 RepID=A0AAT9HFE1_9ACTN